MKRILVTGAAQGIGQAIAELLLKDDQVHLLVIDKQNTKFIETCQQKYQNRFNFYLQDVAVRDKMSKILQQIAKEPINAVINNAGEVYLESWDKFDLKTWDRTLAVNLSAPLQIVYELRNSIDNGASIVNISSVDGICAAFDTIAYAVSKAALINLTKSLAANLGKRGIRVNAVAPGWVETEMTKDTLPEEATYMTPLARNAQAMDVANLVQFLISNKSTFISGETIIIDGGLTVVDYTLKRESEAS